MAVRSSNALACWRRAMSMACWKQASAWGISGTRELEPQRSLERRHLGLRPPHLGRGHQRHGLGQDWEPGLGLPRPAIRLGQQGKPMGAQILWSHVGRVQPLAKKRYAGGAAPCMARAHPRKTRPVGWSGQLCAAARVIKASACAWVAATSRQNWQTRPTGMPPRPDWGDVPPAGLSQGLLTPLLGLVGTA